MNTDGPGSAPKIDIEKGRAIPGYGESLTVNIVTGSPSIGVPLPLTPVRGEAPQLNLQYGGTVGNGPFGIGFALGFSEIVRRTDKGIPNYDDTDVMLLDSQQLTPRYRRDGGGWKKMERVEGGYRVRSYAPRVEESFSLIERWEALDGHSSYWRVIDGQNVASIYGKSETARIADPRDPRRIFKWLLDWREDSRGNRIEASYKAEDATGVPAIMLDGIGPQKYLQSIRYGNYKDGQKDAYAVELLFDYGEYELEPPSATPVRPWATRRDPFISYRAGFPITTARLCRGILTVHRFPDEPDVGITVVGVTTFSYQEEPICSRLTGSRRHGYRKLKDGSFWTQSLPPMRFDYGLDVLAVSRARPLSVAGRTEFPASTGDAYVQMVDLYGDGIPGVLYSDSSAVVYWPAEADGRYGEATLPSEFPNFRALGGQNNLLADICGNGHMDLMVRDAGMPGFFANRNDGRWAPFEAFASAPLELANPAAELTDLSGSGRSDLWIAAGEERLRSYRSQGRTGYGAPMEQAVAADFPAGASAGIGFIGFANVFGDGLSHRIEVRDRSVSVWPNLGHGRFAERKQLANPPTTGPVGAYRIFFADVRGTGFDDLILVDGFSVLVCRNLSGSGFADPCHLDLPVSADGGDQVYFADVCGTGRQSLVIIKTGAEVQGYYMTMAEGAPFHIVAFENGFGKRCRIDYRSTTDFYLADKRRGRPWRGKLPFPMLVVERLTALDGPSGRTVTQCYQYSEGYYDPHEREFAGFGYVRSQDTQVFSLDGWHFPSTPPQPIDPHPVQPLITETWTETGQPFAGDPRSYPIPRFDGTRIAPMDVFDTDIWSAGERAIREAYRALRGRQIAAQETGVGPSGAAEPIPFVAQGQNYFVQMLQPPLDGNSGVFLVTARESCAYRFDGAGDDPRIQQTAALTLDAFGNVTSSASISYPRRPSSAVAPGQETGAVIVGLSDFTNHPFAPGEPYNRIGVNWRSRKLEIHGIDLDPNRLLTYEAIKTEVLSALQPGRQLPYGTPFSGSAVQSRLFDSQRTRFWNQSRDAPAPFGVIGPLALEYDKQTAVFPDAFVKALFGTRIANAMLEPSGGAGAGYLLDDGYWWQSASVTHYGTAETFYSALRIVDPFDAATRLTYDKYFIAIVGFEDALGFKTSTRIDYQTLQPAAVIDPNNITLEALYGPLGKIAATSRFGVIQGRRVGDASLAGYAPVIAPSLPDMLANPEKYLQGAGSYSFEDLSAWADRTKPTYSVLLEADDYAVQSGGIIAERPVAVGLVFVDGSIAVIARQERIERVSVAPKFLPAGGTAGDGGKWCWLTRDQVVRDQKDQVVIASVPYIVADVGYDADPSVPAFRSIYDAVGRIVHVDTPKGFFTRTVYSAWSSVFYDEDDTVKESTYYIEHINDTNPDFADERDALVKSAKLADTPTTSFLDSQGQPIVERRILLAPDGDEQIVEHLDTGNWHDIQGRVIRQADPRFYNGGQPLRFNLEFVFDMLGRTLTSTSTDRGKGEPGTRYLLTDTTGQKLYEWDNAGTRVRQEFDRLRRMVRQRVTPPSGDAFVALLTEYGTAPDTNSIGHVTGLWNQAAIARSQQFDLLGNALAQTRQFVARNDGDPVDWSDPKKVELLPAVWSIADSFNRRGWPTSQSSADGNRQIIGYFANGWRRDLTLEEPQEGAGVAASGLLYNPRADLVSFETMNGIVTDRSYSERTFRLDRTKSIRAKDGTVLVDESYFYDAVGNTTRVRDHLSPPEYFANAIAPPLNDYSYDSLYRLVHAAGRQQAGMARTRKRGPGRQVDPRRMVPFRRRFSYDRSNNLLEVRHAVDQPGDSWTRQLAVSESSNHSVPHKMVAGGRVPDDFFDRNGNLAELDYLRPMTFDYAGRLAVSDVVDRPPGENDRICYAYDEADQRQRKTEYRLVAGNDNQAVTDVFYIGNLAVISAGGSQCETLRVFLGRDCVMSVDRFRPQGKAPEPPRRLFPLSNYQLSVTRETDEAGNVVRLEHYFPFGGTASVEDSGGSGSLRYGFVGKELDQATGFYLMGRRYYCPYLARWLTPDPVGAADGLNLYAYVNDNPTSLVDSTGTNGAEVRGTTQQLKEYESLIEKDHDRAVGFVAGTIDILQRYLDPDTRAAVSGTAQPALNEHFKITGTSETDLANIGEILANFRKIYTYLNQDKPETLRQRLRAWFVDVPLYRIRPDGGTTLAYVQGANPAWPDWNIVPSSLRSRPLSSGWTGWGLAIGGAALLVGGLYVGGAIGIGALVVGELVALGPIVSGSINAVRRLLPSSGINLHENLLDKKGERSRSATIVHESSHLVFGTDDHAYRWQTKYDNLSVTQSMYNADSYGLFAERVTR